MAIYRLLLMLLVAALTCVPVSLYATSSGYVSKKFDGSKRVFPKQINPPGKRVFVFSPKYRAWGAYTSDGRLVGYGQASGGSNWCKELGRPCKTPLGIYSVQRKGSYDCRSSKYPLPNGGAHMPYCMHFHKGYAIHGAPDVPDHNASHGCIRVKTNAAKWLQDYFINVGTKVHVLNY